MIFVLGLALFVLLLAVGVLLVQGSLNKTKWGINFKPTKNCPTCQNPFPRGMRIPADAEEAMWGGWTCKQCGTKVDKWGNIRNKDSMISR